MDKEENGKEENGSTESNGSDSTENNGSQMKKILDSGVSSYSYGKLEDQKTVKVSAYSNGTWTEYDHPIEEDSNPSGIKFHPQKNRPENRPENRA